MWQGVAHIACMSNRDIENVYTKVVQEPRCEDLKPEHLQIIVGVWRKRDVFMVCCPLVLGKLCFAYLPSNCDKIHVQCISKKRAFRCHCTL